MMGSVLKYILKFIFGCAGPLLLCRHFTSCGKRRASLHCGTWAPHCVGVSHGGAWAPQCLDFSSCGAWAW